jgi:AcrR family transcriptional regulator
MTGAGRTLCPAVFVLLYEVGFGKAWGIYYNAGIVYLRLCLVTFSHFDFRVKILFMGRRSSHTAEELRELILDASTALISEGGLCSLSAREVARRIGYSPGTLYNVFENLDDLILTIEGRLIDGLAVELDKVLTIGSPKEKALALGRVYIKYTSENPKLWNLLFEHHLPAGRELPAWYQQKIDGIMERVEATIEPLMPDCKPEVVKRTAQVLWAGVHGITSLATADKLTLAESQDAGPLVDNLITTYLAGLKQVA